MKNILFFTDPHLGVRRSSHTSAKSQAYMQDHLFDICMNIVGEIAPQNDAISYCLGDLFDRYTNPESIIDQGILVASKCAGVLEGNHDRKNNVETISSVHLVQRATNNIITNSEPDKPMFFASTVDKRVTLFFVPHCFTQDLFEKSVKYAIQQITVAQKRTKLVLCLHCNSKPWNGESQLEGSTIGLTDELSGLIVEHFDLCLIGHEHVPQSLRKGKIRVLGNIFPLTFGEIADRYAYLLDLDTLGLKQIKIFDAKKEYTKVGIEELLVYEGEMNFSQSLIEITGELESVNYPQLSRALMNLWKTNDGSLLAVKNSVVVSRASAASPTREKLSARSLPEIVEEEVAKTDLLNTYREVTESIKHEG